MDPIITSALTAFVTASATKGMNAPMQTLDDLWYLVFGDLSNYANKKRAINEANIAKLKDSILKEALEINQENLQEPPMSIVGPALEASKYYIEEEELRKMFAKVIAASMDSSKSDSIHHSFVEIIKQLSPRDARNITEFKYAAHYPIVNFAARKITGESYEPLEPLVYSRLNTFDIDERDFSSITNLIRLGLLTSTFERYLIESTYYDFYRTSLLFEYLNESINKEKNVLEMNEGVISITPLGREFIKVCL